MRDRSIIYLIAIIVIIVAVAYMIKGLAKAPVWFLVLLILVLYFLYKKRKGRLP